MLGQQMLAIVVAWDLYRITRSPIALGNVGLAQVLPVFLFTFVTGQVADRYDRRRTVVITRSEEHTSELQSHHDRMPSSA